MLPALPLLFQQLQNFISSSAICESLFNQINSSCLFCFLSGLLIGGNFLSFEFYNLFIELLEFCFLSLSLSIQCVDFITKCCDFLSDRFCF